MMVFPSLLICEGTLNEARQKEQKPSREPHREINRKNIREVREREKDRERSKPHSQELTFGLYVSVLIAWWGRREESGTRRGKYLESRKERKWSAFESVVSCVVH